MGIQNECFSLWPLCFQMDRCQQRLEQGLPPCPEIEEEWRRMLRDKKRRQRDKAEKERVKKPRHTHKDHWLRKWLKQRGAGTEDREIRIKKEVKWGTRHGVRINFGTPEHADWGEGRESVHTFAHTAETGTEVFSPHAQRWDKKGRWADKQKSGLSTQEKAHMDLWCLKAVQLSAACLLLNPSAFPQIAPCNKNRTTYFLFSEPQPESFNSYIVC